MIPYHRDHQLTIPSSAVKIIGLGGAGSNMLERVALDGTEGAELLAINTDARTLAACVAGEKIQLGRNLTKGLGAGGDPELGQQAMLESEVEIRAALRGCRIVFLCVGLGGGTGSGASPVITRIAREEGAFVVVFATMPFAFEGRRRRDQAETTLNELAVLSNALVTFDNNRMGELVLAKQGIHEAFAAADRMICESIKAVIRLVIRPGLINIGLDDLMSALRTNRSRCLFGSGIAKGKDRASCALRNALSSPLLDQGALLKEAQTVLVHLSGGEDLTLYEVELLMQRLQKFVPQSAHVLFGAVIDPAMGDNLSVTLISALPEDSLAAAPRDAVSSAMDHSGPYADEPAPAPAGLLDPPAVKPRRAMEPSAEAGIASLFDEERSTAIPAVPPVPAEIPVEDPAEAPVEDPAEAPVEDPTDVPAGDLPQPVALAVAAPVEAGENSSPFGQPHVFKPVKRAHIPPNRPWGNSVPDESAATQDPGPDPFIADLEAEAVTAVHSAATAPVSPAVAAESDAPKLKLGVKSPILQNELAFDATPRGRFEGQTPNVVDGEDLDLPPFLRKKK